MRVNGEGIYGTSASPFKELAWGRCTQKVTTDGATLYLHVFEWPSDGKLVVAGLKSAVASAKLLADGHKLATTASPDGLIITLPAAAPDMISSTVVLKVKGALEMD